jgi:hypothetical protein
MTIHVTTCRDRHWIGKNFAFPTVTFPENHRASRISFRGEFCYCVPGFVVYDHLIKEPGALDALAVGAVKLRFDERVYHSDARYGAERLG